MFFFQYLVQAGFFFVVPLFLSVCLGLSALETGARLLPLSVTLLVAAIGTRFLPDICASSSAAACSPCSRARLCCSGRWTQTPGRRSWPCLCF